MNVEYREILVLNDDLFDRIAFIESQCFDEGEAFSREDIPSILEESPIRLGAFVDGELVGYGLARFSFSIGYLYSNAVLPDYRGNRIGSSLCHRRKQSLELEGCHVIQAHTRLNNLASAVVLGKCGLFPRQYVTDFYDDNKDAIFWSTE